MRALIDANLLISYLMLPQGRSNPNLIVEAALAGVFTLLVPTEGIDELVGRITTKRYLAQRIGASDIAALVEALLAVGEVIPKLGEAAPAISRDRKDDYLLAYAVVGRADFLVTGDKDLLSLGTVAGVEIISPADFARRLGDQGLLAETD